MFAAWAVITGVAHIAEGWRVAENRGRSWPFAVLGVLGVAAGIIAALVPGITILGLILLLGWWLVLGGITEIYTAWMIRREVTNEWLLALIGGLKAIVGLAILAQPVIGAILQVALLATWALVGGVVAIALGLRLRSLADRGSRGMAGA